jgi:uncharacterized RDD family membrane protein YckC
MIEGRSIDARQGVGGSRVAAPSSLAAPANWGERLAAFLLDGALVLVVVSLALTPTGVDRVLGWELLGGAILLVVLPLYLALSEGLTHGRTLGKRALRIAARDRETLAPIGYGRAFRRQSLLLAFAASLFVPLLSASLAPVTAILSLVLGADYLWPLWDRRKQALHDKLASSLVVDTEHGQAVSLEGQRSPARRRRWSLPMLVVLGVSALLAGATVISVVVVATRGGRSVADSAKCLVGKGLIATPGTIHVPKGVVVTKANVATGTVSTNKRAFTVPELDVIGAESAVMAGNPCGDRLYRESRRPDGNTDGDGVSERAGSGLLSAERLSSGGVLRHLPGSALHHRLG